MGIKHTKIRSVPISAKIYCEIFLFDFVALLYLLLRVLNMEVQDIIIFFQNWWNKPVKNIYLHQTKVHFAMAHSYVYKNYSAE